MNPLLPLIFLFLAGLVSGWVDSIAGGGGIISVPALWAMGLPTINVLATNKIASSCGSSTATVRYFRQGYILPIAWPMAVVALAASALGASFAAVLTAYKPWVLDVVVSAALVTVAVVTALRPAFGQQARPWPHRRRWYYGTAMAAAGSIGFYDGLVGPGTGTFLAFTFVLALGAEFRFATGSTKVINFATNIAAAAYFALTGLVHWYLAAALGAGILTGAYIGSGMAMRVGPRLIRPIFILVALAVAVWQGGKFLHYW